MLAAMNGGKTRVLHLLPWLAEGGVEQRRLVLAQQLDPTRYEQRIACATTRAWMEAAITAAGTPIEKIGGTWTVTDLRSIRRVRAIIEDWRPDIVHGAVFEGVSMAALGPPLGWRGHVILEEIAFPTGRSWRSNLLLRLLAFRADRFVAVSPAVGEYLRDELHLGDAVRRVIDNGVSAVEPAPPEQVEALRAELGLPPDAFVVGSAGRLDDSVKRFSDLIRATAKLRDRVDGIHLVIAGGGRDGPVLERLAEELGVADRIVLAGHHERMAPVYGLFDVFALASNRESFGLVLAEAMFASLPVVSTAVGGPRDIVVDGETGIHVEVGDIDAIARALEELAVDPALRQRLGDAGLERARRCYSAERYARDVAALYDELVPPARRAAAPGPA